MAEAALATPAPCEAGAAERVAIREAIFSATDGSALTAAATPAATALPAVLYILERGYL